MTVQRVFHFHLFHFSIFLFGCKFCTAAHELHVEEPHWKTNNNGMFALKRLNSTMILILEFSSRTESTWCGYARWEDVNCKPVSGVGWHCDLVCREKRIEMVTVNVSRLNNKWRTHDATQCRYGDPLHRSSISFRNIFMVYFLYISL